MANPIVFFDMTLGGVINLSLSRFMLTLLAGEPLGRIKMELFADVTPKVVQST